MIVVSDTSPLNYLVQNMPRWLKVVSPAIVDPTLAGLGKGEAEAISLAGELHADLLLTDDKRARRFAEDRLVRTIGTLGVLEMGGLRGLVDGKAAIEELRRTKFRVAEELLVALLARIELRKSQDRG